MATHSPMFEPEKTIRSFLQNGKLDIDLFSNHPDSVNFVDDIDFVPGRIGQKDVPKDWWVGDLSCGFLRCLLVYAEESKLPCSGLRLLVNNKDILTARLRDISEFYSSGDVFVNADDAFAYLVLHALGGGMNKWKAGFVTGEFKTFDDEAQCVGVTKSGRSITKNVEMVNSGFGMNNLVYPRPASIAPLLREINKISAALVRANEELPWVECYCPSSLPGFVRSTRVITIVLSTIGMAYTNRVIELYNLSKHPNDDALVHVTANPVGFGFDITKADLYMPSDTKRLREFASNARVIKFHMYSLVVESGGKGIETHEFEGWMPVLKNGEPQRRVAAMFGTAKRKFEEDAKEDAKKVDVAI